MCVGVSFEISLTLAVFYLINALLCSLNFLKGILYCLPITSKNSCNVVCCKISGKETLDFLLVDDLDKFALVAKLVVSLSTPKSSKRVSLMPKKT